MKQILLGLIAITLIGCAKSESSNPQPTPTPAALTCSDFAGHYRNEIYFGETLDIDDQCNFTDSICGYDASFTLPENSQTTISVRNTDGTPGCMSSTDHLCEISFNGDDLAVMCDNGAQVFGFDKD